MDFSRQCMSVETIVPKQSDGYEVLLDGETVIFSKQKPPTKLNVSHFKPFSELPSDIQATIKNKLSDVSGLWAMSYHTPVRIRDVGDAIKRISEEAERVREVVRKRNEERDARFSAEKLEQDKKDAVHIRKMLDDESKMVALIPDGCIRINPELNSDGDGSSYVVWHFEGEPIVDGPHIIGVAVAIRQNALSDFDRRYVAYITQSEADAIRKRKSDRIEKERLELEEKNEKRRLAEEKARLTDEPQVLSTWVTAYCQNARKDCSFDNARLMVYPDGSTKIVYSCCY